MWVGEIVLLLFTVTNFLCFIVVTGIKILQQDFISVIIELSKLIYKFQEREMEELRKKIQ